MAHVPKILATVFCREGDHYTGDPLDVVVFGSGTVVLRRNNGDFDPVEAEQRAKACLAACGPVVHGDMSADFEPVRLDSHSEIVLKGRICVIFQLPECEAYNSFLVYGIPAERCPADEQSLLQMGSLQRARRQNDYEKMEVEVVYRIE